MKRLIAVVAATIVAASVAACSNGNKSSSPPTVSGTAAPAGGSPKLTVDGQPQNVVGPVSCVPRGGSRLSIFFEPPAGSADGVAVYLEPDASVVYGVVLGRINGVDLTYWEGESPPGENATATKDGNHYKITGTAGGETEPIPPQQLGQKVSKPFEIDVTCP